MGISDLFKPNVEKMKQQRDIKGLVKALNHKDEIIRYNATVALAELVPYLMEVPIAALVKMGLGFLVTTWAMLGDGGFKDCRKDDNVWWQKWFEENKRGFK